MSETTIPNDRKYTTDHLWVQVESQSNDSDAVLKVGLTTFAADAIGEVVFVKFPRVGSDIGVDLPMCEVEAAKAMTEVYAPFSAQVAGVNVALESDPGSVNSDPYGSGWLVKIHPSAQIDLDELLDDNEYRKLVQAD